MPISLNAPFDPDDSRRDLRETAWNEWLFEELAVLASRVVDHRYEDAPASVWRAVPTPDESVTQHDWLDDRLSVLRRAAADALVSIEFQPPNPEEEPSLIEEGAYEPEWLDGLVSPAQLTIRQRAVLPEALRDGLGRWRKVLRESHLGRQLEPEEVISFAGSPDEDLQTPAPGWWANLTSAFLSHRAVADLKDAATIVLDDGRRVSPADVDAGLILTRQQTDAPVPVVATLHAAYLSNRQFASRITSWLERTGRLATKLDDPRLLRALADWEGDAHNLEDAALVWLQRALWSIEDDEGRQRLGTRIGRRVALDGHWFDEGSRRRGPVVVGDSYLPPAFTHVRDSFARAAGDAPDLSWIAVRYDKVLRPSAERSQDGALATLRLLGARAAPPLEERPGAKWARYAEGAPAYHFVYAPGRLQEDSIRDLPGPPAEALQGDRGAEDLLAVARHIEQETDQKKRQVRARALFATLSREWLGSYADGLHATAVEGYHRWNRLGNVPTTWRSELADIEWLTGPRGEPGAPYNLALRTAALEAAHGDNEPYAVEADASLAHATDLAAALGMSVQPAASGLIDELRNLRDVSGEYTQEAVAQQTNALLRALALLCPPADSDVQRDTMVDDRSAAQLRGYFGIRRGRPGLIYHEGRWWPPSGAVLGNRVFGRYRVALQQDPDVIGRLWNVLDIHPPRVRDCVAVLGEMAEHDLAPGDTGTYIGILRLLSALADGRRIEDLSVLPIWCGDAWRTRRPIYASYDPGLAESLRSEVPVWEPRCSLDTLGDLPRLMNVSILDAQQLTPSGIDAAATAQGSLYHSLFGGAVEHFRDLCATVDPDLYGALEHDWQNLADAKLAVSPNLSCTGQLGRRQVTVSVNTHASKAPALLAACDSALLGSEQMGTSLAASWVRGEDALGVDYFKAGVLWAKAWQRSLDGLPAQGVELAERVASDDDLAVLQAKISGRDLPPPRKRGAGACADDADPLEAALPVRLKDAAMLVPNPPTTVGSNGRRLGTTHTNHQQLATSEEVIVARATSGESRPRRRTVPDRDPQDVAIEILKVALRSSDSNELDDLREVRGIGADAIDDLLGFIEMKHDVHEPPDQVVLLRSQQLRGREMKSNFILAVVSGLLEGSRTVVRLYPDPLGTLEFEAPSSLTPAWTAKLSIRRDLVG